LATNIAAIRANVRKDLHDEDSAAYRWTDAALDRHIGRAALEYSLHAPREQRSTLTATPGSREISVATLVDRIDIEAVEWPVAQFPPRRVGWSAWQDTITLDVTSAPAAADNVYIYWTKPHTLDAGTSTIPPHDDDIVAAGGAGYAALDWTSFSINRINTGGDDVWGRYKALADERAAYFMRELRRIGRANVVRQRRMYTTDAPSAFQQDRVSF